LKHFSTLQGRQEDARVAYDIAQNAARPFEKKTGAKYDAKKQQVWHATCSAIW
jgi:hypothetical protein